MLRIVVASVATLFVATLLWSAPATAGAEPLLNWSEPLQLDPGSPSQFSRGAGIDCVGDDFCLAVGGSGRLLVSTEPLGGFEGWIETAIEQEPADDLTSVSCPGVDFCAVVDAGGHLFTTDEPTEAGSWDRAAIDPGVGLTDISCPSPSFCAAVDSAGNVLVSSEPASGSAAWQAASIATSGDLPAISCSSTALCVVIHDEGLPDSRILVSTDPLAGAGSWKDGGANLENAGFDVSCTSDSFCAVAYWKGIVVSNEPAGGAGAWRSSYQGEYIDGISCSSEAFCVGEDYGGGIVASGDPAAASPAWKEFDISPDWVNGLRGIDCTGAAFCAMVDGEGSVYTSTDPGGEPEDWTSTPTGSRGPELDSVACPTATFCATSGTLGRLYTSTDPTDPASWSATDVGDSISGISCTRENWCVAEAGGTSILYSEEPGAGAGAWQTIGRPLGGPLSCPSLELCAQLTKGDDLLQTTSDPLAGRFSWSSAEMQIPDNRLGPGHLSAVSCPSGELCLLGGGGGQLLASATPTAGREAWVAAWVPGGGIVGLDCPTASFCAATTWNGTVATSTEPLGGLPAWSVSDSPESYYLGEISCADDASLCVAIDRNGNAISSATPLATSAHWGTLEPIDEPESLTDVSCAADGSLCAAVDDKGRLRLGTRRLQGQGSDGEGSGGQMPSSSGGASPRRSHCLAAKKHGRAARRHRRAAKTHRIKPRLAVGQARRVSSGGRPAKTRCGRLR
jgi:hypothetical protein